MYISTQSCALGTPSKFSSVPILVAVELDPPLLCITIPRGVPFHQRNYLSLEQSSYDCDLAIRIVTTRNTQGMHEQPIGQYSYILIVLHRVVYPQWSR